MARILFHPMKGRGAVNNPQGRFEKTARAVFEDGWDDGWAEEESLQPLHTVVEPEQARTIISRNDSPDISFTQSINPYRGCEHGCIYCFARPTHSFLGLSPGLDFETRLFAKVNAGALLKEELAKPSYQCEVIAIGGVTDPYQPVEREWKVMRQVIEMLAETKHPCAIVTKSALIERDLDLLEPMAAENLVQVFISITTLDRKLARYMEPRAAAPERRVACVENLTKAGVPVGVLVAPIIPALNDRDLESILAAASDAGASSAGHVLLRLPHELKGLFKDWLEQHYPERAEHVMSLIRQMRDGKEYDAEWGTRMEGKGVFAQLLKQRFEIACNKLGLNKREYKLDTTRFKAPSRNGQLALF